MTCETCKYHITENVSGEKVCTNPDSDYLGIATDDKDFRGGCEIFVRGSDGSIHNKNT